MISSSLSLLSGVHLIERSKSRQILKQFTLRELDRWGYKPGILFYFEVKLDRKESTSIEFGTRDGLKMANLLTDYAHALIQEAEIQKVHRMSLRVQQTIDADERNLMSLSASSKSQQGMSTTSLRLETSSTPPPPPPPPPSKRNSLPNGNSILSVEQSPRAHRASFTATTAAQPTPPPPPPSKQVDSLSPKRLPGLGTAAPAPAASRLSVRGSPSAPPPPPPPPKTSNRPFSQRLDQPQPPPYHHQCAIMIQSNYRGYALRSSWIKEDASIVIQSVYRGYAERCRVAVLLEEMYRSGQLELLDEES
jgi:hypothetical protein